MRFKTRYRFWNIFWVMLALWILFGCIAIIAYALVPNKEAMNEITKLKSIPARIHLIRYSLAFLFSVFFFYFTTNYFYNLIAQKKKFISYLRVSVIILLACF